MVTCIYWFLKLNWMRTWISLFLSHVCLGVLVKEISRESKGLLNGSKGFWVKSPKLIYAIFGVVLGLTIVACEYEGF